MNFYEIEWKLKIRVTAKSPDEARQRAAQIVGLMDRGDTGWFLGTSTQITGVECYYGPCECKEDDDGN